MKCYYCKSKEVIAFNEDGNAGGRFACKNHYEGETE